MELKSGKNGIEMSGTESKRELEWKFDGMIQILGVKWNQNLRDLETKFE